MVLLTREQEAGRLHINPVLVQAGAEIALIEMETGPHETVRQTLWRFGH